VETLEPGLWVALTLRPNTAPSRCYVGQVEAVDDKGVRIRLVDRLSTKAPGTDFFTTWESISAALVAPAFADLDLWWVEALKWQHGSNEMSSWPAPPSLHKKNGR
jgi:hypothetical protein